MTKKYPHVPAAFINALMEGPETKSDIIHYLQEQWNETCALEKRIKELEGFISSLESNQCGCGV